MFSKFILCAEKDFCRQYKMHLSAVLWFTKKKYYAILKKKQKWSNWEWKEIQSKKQIRIYL